MVESSGAMIESIEELCPYETNMKGSPMLTADKAW